jgi:hypothetical protein
MTLPWLGSGRVAPGSWLRSIAAWTMSASQRLGVRGPSAPESSAGVTRVGVGIARSAAPREETGADGAGGGLLVADSAGSLPLPKPIERGRSVGESRPIASTASSRTLPEVTQAGDRPAVARASHPPGCRGGSVSRGAQRQ